MIRKFTAAFAFAALVIVGVMWAASLFGQGVSTNTNTFYTPGNQSVGGTVIMCLNGSVQAVPCASAGGTSGFLTVSLTTQYPFGALAITGNSTGTTGAVTGTLAANAARTTYICGFNVSAIGGTAESGPITVAGLIGSSQVYQVPANATGGQVLVSQTFNPCIPGSAANTAITITTTAAVGATAVDVNSWGYQL